MILRVMRTLLFCLSVLPAAAGLLLAPASPCGASAGGNMNPALAFDVNHNRYLVVYGDLGGSGYTIYGQLLDPDGTPYNGGAPFVIAGPDATKRDLPAVAFDPVDDRYLVAWAEGATGSIDVLARLVAADGTPAAGTITVSSAAQDQTYPSVAYDLVHQRFLVVWHDDRSGSEYDIYGQLIDAGGNLYDPSPADATDLTDPTVNFVVSEDPVNFTDRQTPRAAFDPQAQRYLVVWEDSRSSPDKQIYGQLLDADGALVGTDAATNFGIGIAAANTESAPALADDPANQRFLVVWHDSRNRSTSGFDIYGRLVHADGTMPAAEFAVSDAPDDQAFASAAYDLASPGYVVTFLHEGIYSPLFQIDPATGDASYIGTTNIASPAGLAYDPASSTLYATNNADPAQLYSLDTGTGAYTYLGASLSLGVVHDLAWDANGSTLYAVGTVNGSGNTNQSLFTLDPAQPTGNDTLVGALPSSPFNVDGMAFDGSGTLYGLSPTASGSDLVTLDTSSGAATVQHHLAAPASLSSLTYDPGTGKLFAISSYGNDNNVEGQRVGTDGTLAGASTDSQPIAMWDDYRLAQTLATDPYCGNALAGYIGSNPSSGISEVKYAAIGTCSGAPWLAYAPAAILSQGVTAGAAAGDTFTFQVRYGSAGDTAPAQAELWIDLNGDGSYTAASAGTAAGGGTTPGPGTLALAALLGLAGLGLLCVRGARRPAAGLAVLGLVLGLTVLGVSACQSSSSGGSSNDNNGTPAPSGPQERFTMTAVDSADTNYADGKLYTVDVPIADSGTYTYVFSFSDGTSAAVGAPAVSATLTVP